MAEDEGPGGCGQKANPNDRVGILLAVLLAFGWVFMFVDFYALGRRDRAVVVGYFVIWTVAWAVWSIARRRQLSRPPQ